MDDAATRFISSALTMYDIMERRVTLVEQLKKNRQPFSDMDVVYLASPTIESAKKICGDFESRNKAKYGTVHIIFTESVCVIVHLLTSFYDEFYYNTYFSRPHQKCSQ